MARPQVIPVFEARGTGRVGSPDSSAIVPVILEEARSAACRRLLRADGAVAVWALTRLEVRSALQRKKRRGELSAGELAVAVKRCALAASRWTEVDQLAPVAEHCERLLATHPLSAADALQLGAALVLVGGRARRRSFVTADDRLAEAAEIEGFDVVVPADV